MNKRALLVGINYNDPASLFGPLKWAEKDAEGLGKLLSSNFGFAGWNLVGPSATWAAANALFKEISEMGALDTFLFFFAGHGEVIHDEVNIPKHHVHFAGSEPQTLGLGAISLGHLLKTIRTRIKARNYIIILDACRERVTQTGGQGNTVALDPVESVSGFSNAPAMRGDGAGNTEDLPVLVTILSCSAGEVSHEHDDLEHGVLTWALMAALKAEPLAAVQTLPLAKLCREESARLSLGSAQTPQTVWSSIRSVYFAEALPGPGAAVSDSVRTDKGRQAKIETPRTTAIPQGRAVIGCAVAYVNRLDADLLAEAKRLDLELYGAERSPLIPGFQMSRYAVSNDEYRSFVEATDWPEPRHWRDGGAPMGDRPVVNVSFSDAEAFCQFHSYRLASDVEWERAARGAAGNAYPWGSEWPEGEAPCRSREEGPAELAAVTVYAAFHSPDGLVQMAGNVWEWVDGGAGDRKYVRGGSWRDPGKLCALGWVRRTVLPGPDETIGFRYVAAREAEPPVHNLEACVEVPLLPGIHPFRIRRHLVTNEEYYMFAERQRKRWPQHWAELLLRIGEPRLARPFLLRYRWHPVHGVRYEDALAFCRWRDARLPTEAEWELAAMGANASTHADNAPGAANSLESGWGRTTRVDAYPSSASPFGCLDMGGNVWEWVAGDSGAYVVRGGSYHESGDQHRLRAFHRNVDPLSSAIPIGFRYVEAGG